MNDETTNLDQTDEDILIYTVSNEALEAAGTEGGCSSPFHPPRGIRLFVV
jgi:hypothetical protein